MTASDAKRCENCRFWKALKETPKSDMGLCQHSPPTIIAGTQSSSDDPRAAQSVWPTTGATERCSFWQDKDGPTPPPLGGGPGPGGIGAWASQITAGALGSTLLEILAAIWNILPNLPLGYTVAIHLPGEQHNGLVIGSGQKLDISEDRPTTEELIHNLSVDIQESFSALHEDADILKAEPDQPPDQTATE